MPGNRINYTDYIIDVIHEYRWGGSNAANPPNIIRNIDFVVMMVPLRLILPADVKMTEFI